MSHQEDHRHTVENFIAQNGRRPRVLVVNTDKATQSGMRFATLYADLGCDVDISASGVEPKLVVRQALENDVHLIFIVFGESEAAEALIGELLSLRLSEGIEDIPVMVRATLSSEVKSRFAAQGVILPPQDEQVVEHCIEELRKGCQHD